MNRFINLKVSKIYNYIFLNKKDISKVASEEKIPYDKILNNLIVFLYKKLTPFLFQEVKNFLNVQYMKYKNKSFNYIQLNTNTNDSYSKISFNSEKRNNSKNRDNFTARTKKENIKYQFELTGKTPKTNFQKSKKIYVP
jgi:hypothetical protein